MKHNPIWMIIGCLLPLLLIFMPQLFGIKSNNIFLIFFLAMFACHFLMMGRYGGHQHSQEDSQNKQESGSASSTISNILQFILRVGYLKNYPEPVSLR